MQNLLNLHTNQKSAGNFPPLLFQFISIDQQCQLVLGIFKGELWLIIRQSHLEGMLPYEYSAILKTLNVLNISQTQVYFEASSVNDETLNNKSHHISNLNYFNKRFFKLTETQTFQDHSGEIKSNLHLGVSTQEQQQSQRTLIAYEGTMLPSKTELAFAQKGKFDLYTVTNFSFADLAQHLKVDLVLNAVSKHNLVQAEEIVVPNVFQQEINQASPFTDVQPIILQMNSLDLFMNLLQPENQLDIRNQPHLRNKTLKRYCL